jgi:hypothetical protein
MTIKIYEKKYIKCPKCDCIIAKIQYLDTLLINDLAMEINLITIKNYMCINSECGYKWNEKVIA